MRFFILASEVIHTLFRILYCNSKHSVYNIDYFPTKQLKKVRGMQFLSNGEIVYSGKKAGFDCKKNYQ